MNLDQAKQLAREGTPVHRAAWTQPFARLVVGVASPKKLTRTCHSKTAPPDNGAQPLANADEPMLLVAITDAEISTDDAPRWVPTTEDVDADDYQPWEPPAEPQVVEPVTIPQATGGNDAA